MATQLEHVNQHDHLCLLYETQEEQAAAFVPFIHSGLVQNELCVYVVDETDKEWILQQLRKNEFPIDNYIARGAFRIINTMDAYLRNGCFELDQILTFWDDLIKSALADGYQCVRATGEMTWALRDFPGCDRMLEYESRINSVLPKAKMIGLCQYNRKRFDPAFMQKVIHTHPFVCVSNQLMNNPGFVNQDAASNTHDEFQLQAMIDNMLMSKRLLERQQECEALYHELISLARVVSHELQAPLTVMQAYLRLLGARYKGKLGADADEFIEKATSSSLLVARMVDALWNYARVDSPADSVSEDVSVLPVVNEVLNELESGIKAADAVVDHDKSFPTVRMARRKLAFLLKELIENALKYSRSDVTPEIYIGCQDKDNEWLFHVRDNGMGIDSVHKSDVFKLFQRLGGGPDENGVGMGLPVCQRIANFYGGDIWFESTPGSGATFFFSIPKPTLMTKVRDMDGYRRERAQRQPAR